MCGICGLCAPSRGLADAGPELSSMLAAISHRGPDAHGVKVDDPAVALGSTRLAIIDLRRGNQPILSEDGSISAVYNGEIYNYRELQRELVDRGHVLASQSDSEVIVHLYEEYGIDFVKRLNGMFAFALWDARARVLYVVRDRYGIKPVYYHWDGEALTFASEVKAILDSGRVRASLDPNAYLELLTFQNILSAHSLFRDISLLPAAGILRLDERGISISNYWDPMPHPEPVADVDGLPGLVAEYFERGVERQLMSDVEVASYLSGGLDTGAVTAFASRRLDRLTTFATGFDTSGAEGMEAEFDERRDAVELARELGTHHHELLLDPHDLEMVLPRLVYRIEEPRMSFSYPNYLTAGMASRWVKVVLSGVGGDELFGGYPWRYAIAEEADFMERYYDYWTRLLSVDEMKRAFAPEFLAQLDLDHPRATFDSIIGPSEGLSALDRILYFESKTFLHGLLVIEDKLSMAHSLESRVPFLDNDLVDFVLRLPAEVKLKGARSKDLFRSAMSGKLPDNVVHRKKTGFTPPQATWFQGSQSNYLEAVLFSERALDRGLFRTEFIRDVLEGHRSGRTDRRLLIWTLLCMEWWHRIFIDGEHSI
jgi:asparagine synthase (glutamine-hydrolysing)